MLYTCTDLLFVFLFLFLGISIITFTFSVLCTVAHFKHFYVFSVFIFYFRAMGYCINNSTVVVDFQRAF